MTTYVLHWGWSWILANCIADIKNKYSLQHKKILLLYHAKDLSEWKESFLKDVTSLQKIWILEDSCQAWSADLNSLILQIKKADVVIIKGGSAEFLCQNLFLIKGQLEDLFKNKIVMGISAWAYLLSKTYFSNDRKAIYDWFWLIDFNVICHYEDNMSTYAESLYAKNCTDTLKLKESEYVILDAS